MKVLIDYQILCMQKYGGISKYTYNMIHEIMNYKEIEFEIPVLVSVNEYFCDIIKGKTLKRYPRKGKRILRMINKLNTVLYMMLHKVDVYHPTYYDPYLLKLCYLKKVKIVVTIHDMIHELFENKLPDAKKTISWKKRFIYESDIIIAVSENTKKDILKFYPDINPQKIKVIYEGGICNKNVDKIAKLPERYILYVGKRGNYKNFIFFLISIIKILKERDINLVCVGGGKFNEEEKELIQKYEIENKVKWMECTENELNDVYQKAIAFVYPSLYEGFGIPILEAFTNGCPVVCSSTSCFPEIAGDAALYFDPGNQKDICEKILLIIDDKRVRENCVDKGKRRNEFFSWKKMGQEIEEEYYNVVHY